VTLLTAPPGTGPAETDRTGPDRTDRPTVHRRLDSGIASLVGGLPGGGPLVITTSVLGRRPSPFGGPIGAGAGAEEPFRWKPVLVRRSLGLAAVEACVAGRFRAPAEAVGPIADEAVAEWRHTGWRQFHWEPWMSGLSAGGRAVVVADAVGWASALWSSFDWDSLGVDLRFGGGWDRWTWPGPRPVVLKARPDVRFAPAGRAGHPGRGAHALGTSVVAVRSGSPGAGWRGELAFVALVGALAAPSRPVATRVQGLWPDAGIHRSVEIDDSVLDLAVDQVIAAVGDLLAAGTAGCRAPGALG
jgi:hypothetical protein